MAPTCREAYGDYLLNRKGYYSLIMQVVCDDKEPRANLKFRKEIPLTPRPPIALY